MAGLTETRIRKADRLPETGGGFAARRFTGKRVLLAASGLSPQVITETLFALAVMNKQPWVPDAIVVVTTAEGAERVRLSLLSENPGWFRRLREDYRIPEIDFDESCLCVVSTEGGQPLDDIRSLEDNEAVANCITRIVRGLTMDTAELHVSIAGGRKTMGYYLGYALSLYGRPQDRLSHVLVSEPFESSWDFFYPTPYRRVITTRDNRLADTSEANVTLAEIPFIPLREGLPKRLLEGAVTFGQSVAAARRAIEEPRLVVDLARRCLEVSGEVVQMAPADLAFFTLFVRDRVHDGDGLLRNDPGLAAEFLREYENLVGPMSGDLDRAQHALRHGMDTAYFDQRKSRTNAAIRAALGQRLARHYLIHPMGSRSGRFGLTLAANALEVVEISGSQRAVGA